MRQAQSNTSAKNGSFDSRCPAMTQGANGAALFRWLTLSGLRFHSEAFLFHHRPADPKSVEPAHCQVGPPLALQARQGLLIRAHRSYAHWKPRIKAPDQRERQVHATLFTFAKDQSEFSA